MGKLKTYIQNAVKYNEALILTAMESLDGFKEKPKSRGLQQLVMLTANEMGKAVAKISTLLEIYDQVSDKPLPVAEEVSEQVKIFRQHFLNLKGDKLETLDGTSINELFNKIAKKEADERESNDSPES